MVESASMVEMLGHERNTGFSSPKTMLSRTSATGAASFIQISSEPSARRTLDTVDSVLGRWRVGAWVVMGEDPRSVWVCLLEGVRDL